MMSEFFLFNNIPYDIKKLVVPWSQFPREAVYKTKQYVLGVCHQPDAVVPGI